MQFVISYAAGVYSWVLTTTNGVIAEGLHYPDLPSLLVDVTAIQAGAASAPINCPPPTVTLTATPASLPVGGGTVTLTWTSTYATAVTANGQLVPLSGSVSVDIDATTAFAAIATGPGGSASASATVTVNQPVPPPVQPATIQTPWDTIPNFGQFPTVWSVRDGNWSDPGVWSGNALPTDGAVVAVQHAVAYDVVSASRITTVSVLSGGSLAFRPDVSTSLVVQNLLVNVGASLTIGTAANPIQATVAATVEFINAPLTATDTLQYGNGLIVLGSITTFGQPKSPFIRLAAEPKAGDTSLILLGSATNWQTGDHLVLSDTRHLKPSEHGGLAGTGAYTPQSEIVAVTSLSFPVATGQTVTVGAPLTSAHLGARDASGALRLCPHVANLTRNVVFRSESASGTRGYFFPTASASVNVQNTGFFGMGRSTVALPSATNIMQRHAVTLSHLTAPIFANNAVFCPLNPMPFRWGIAIHATSGATIQGNVVNNWAGAGIMDDADDANVIDGNWVGNINNGNPSSDRADARQGKDFGFEGVCYWFRGNKNTVTNNVAAGGGYGAQCSYGFVNGGVYGSLSLNSAPLANFSGNEAYGALGGGWTPWWLGTQDVRPIAGMQPSTVQGLAVWHAHMYGVYLYNANLLNIQNLTVLNGNVTGGGDFGVWCSDYVTKDVTLTNPDIEGCAVGIGLPKFCAGDYIGGAVPPLWKPGTFSVQGGVLANKVNVRQWTIGAGGAHPKGSDLPGRTVTLGGITWSHGPGWIADIDMVFLPPSSNPFVNVTAPDELLLQNGLGSQPGSCEVYWPQLNPPPNAVARAGINGGVVV